MARTEKDRKILERRATAAAAHREQAREPSGRLLVFSAAGQAYGIDLAHVSAISMIRSMTPLPGVPRALAGLLNVRGRNVTAVDLGLFFGGRAKDARRIVDAGKAVTVGFASREIAFIAEELSGIRELFEGDLELLTGASAQDPVKSVTKDGVYVLDIAALFQDPRLSTRGSRGAR
jgi:purine-binding chemotaxis protein CheW